MRNGVILVLIALSAVVLALQEGVVTLDKLPFESRGIVELGSVKVRVTQTSLAATALRIDAFGRTIRLSPARVKAMTTFLYVFTALFVGLVVGGRYRAYVHQNRGEALLARSVRANFNTPDHHLLNHITFSLEDGTTQIDHILVSRFGVFVIETKDYKGWIFANPTQAKWTQVLFRTKFKFQNPIFQNRRHVRAVQDLLDFLPHEAIHSVVVFVGEAEFKTGVPSGVYSLDSFVDHVRACTQTLMSLNRMHFCVGRLEASRLAITGKTDVEHVRSLERRHGSVA
jgi:hypothetical protein